MQTVKEFLSSSVHGIWLFLLTFLACPCPIHAGVAAGIGVAAVQAWKVRCRHKQCESHDCGCEHKRGNNERQAVISRI